MSRFFDPESPLSRALSAVFDWAALSLTAAVCALPLITAGASVSALYAVAQTENAGPGDFLRRFRRDLRRTLPLGISFLAAAGLLAADFFIIFRMPPAVRAPLWGGLFFLGACLLLAGTVVFPLATSATGVPWTALWKRALLLSIAKLPRTLAMLAAAAAPLLTLAGGSFLFLCLWPVWLFIWPLLIVKIWFRLGGSYLTMEDSP